jgi:hypothetical protein
MSETITRIYGKAEHAEAAVRRLKSLGFTDDVLSCSDLLSGPVAFRTISRLSLSGSRV